MAASASSPSGVVAVCRPGQFEQPGCAGAAVVVRDERVSGEQEAEEVGAVGRAEVEHVRGPLSGPAGDEEDRPARRSGRCERLDVERDAPGDGPRPVEGHDDVGADETARRAAWRRRAARRGYRAEKEREPERDAERPQAGSPTHRPRVARIYELARRRAPSKRLAYQPAIVEMRTTVPEWGAWMKRP